jgi:hypothetical protein
LSRSAGESAVEGRQYHPLFQGAVLSGPVILDFRGDGFIEARIECANEIAEIGLVDSEFDIDKPETRDRLSWRARLSAPLLSPHFTQTRPEQQADTPLVSQFTVDMPTARTFLSLRREDGPVKVRLPVSDHRPTVETLRSGPAGAT